MNSRFLESLYSAVGGAVVATNAVRLVCARDASRLEAVQPVAVVRPRDIQTVVATVKVCSDFCVPIYTRGGASGLSGGSLVTKPGVVLDLAPMRGITSISPRDRTITALAGTLVGQIQSEAAKHALLFPPDPASAAFCSLGGTIAENAGGLRALKYGTTAHHLLAATVVTGAGDLLDLGTPTHKNVAGLNLLGLLCGSEGTLAIVCEATMRLLPAPKAIGCVGAVFKTEEEAIEAALALLEHRFFPRALEFVDGLCSEIVGRLSSEARGWARGNPFLLVEFDGCENGVREECSEAATLLHKTALTVIKADHHAAEKLWSARRLISTALSSAAKLKISQDVCLPPSRLIPLYTQLRSLSKPPHILSCAYGHLGDGNLHINFLLDSPERAPVKELLEMVLRMRGTITGEHGIGVAKLDYLRNQIGADSQTLMRRIKRLFDPAYILNPDKAY